MPTRPVLVGSPPMAGRTSQACQSGCVSESFIDAHRSSSDRIESDFMTKRYEGAGFSCLYPENWQLLEETEGEDVVGFTLQSPRTSFLTALRYAEHLTPRSAVEQAAQAIVDEYDEVDVQSIEPSLIAGELALVEPHAVELNFYYMDLLVTAQLLAFHQSDATVLVQVQAEDKEFQENAKLFQAMLFSLASDRSTDPERKKASPDQG
jgi:hypothetical protein